MRLQRRRYDWTGSDRISQPTPSNDSVPFGATPSTIGGRKPTEANKSSSQQATSQHDTKPTSQQGIKPTRRQANQTSNRQIKDNNTSTHQTIADLLIFVNFLPIRSDLILTAAVVSASRVPISFLNSTAYFSSLVLVVYLLLFCVPVQPNTLLLYQIRRRERTNTPSTK